MSFFQLVNPHAEAHRGQRRAKSLACLLDDAVQDLFNLELAFRLQIGRASPAFANDAAVSVGQQRERLGATGVDSEDVHGFSLLVEWMFPMVQVRSPRAVGVVCGIALCVFAAATPFRAAAPEQTRALWVTRTTLSSPDAIRQMVAAAQAGGFNTLLVQVRGRGDAYYNGTLEPRANELLAKPSFDPLATVLEQAHGAGMKVHAWVAVNLVSSSVTLPASRDHVIYRAPEWLMVPRELAAAIKKVDSRSPA